MKGGSSSSVKVYAIVLRQKVDRHHHVPEASDADLLRHLMEAEGVMQIQPYDDTGLAKSVVSEVLAGRKPFRTNMIAVLGDYFHVPASVFPANVGKK